MSEHYSRIFLLSHMRAYTSLAGHILGSHPAINGYYEMHISYDDDAALEHQIMEFRQHETLKPNSRYLFDKLLHNDYQLKPDRLSVEDIKILVALRQPEQTIKSIVDLFSNKKEPHIYASPEHATRYYIERLEYLTDFCRNEGHDYYYFDAEMFQRAPDVLLPGLSNWLELDSPLSDRYQLFNLTGEARKGDSSEQIHSGRIDKTRIDYPHIDLPKDELKKAKAVYRDCRHQMITHATDAAVMPARKQGSE